MLDDLVSGVSNASNHVSFYVSRLLDVMEYGVRYTTVELMELLNMKSRGSFRDNYLLPAISNGLVKMSFPDSPSSRNQTYYRE